MFPYIALISYWGLSTILLNHSLRGKLRNKNIIFTLIASFSLFLIMALRDVSVGTDTYGYFLEFTNAEFYLNLKVRQTEIGYSYFNYFINELGFNFQGYLALVTIIVVYSISRLYANYSKNIMMSYFLHVTIGIFAMTMSGLRQSIAISLTILAFIQFIEGRRIRFSILVVLAYFFHNSALVFLPLLFLNNVRLTKKKASVIYLVGLFTFFARNQMTELVRYITPDRYVRYFENIAVVNPLIIMVFLVIPLAALVFWPNTKEYDDKYNKILSSLFILSCVNFVIYFFATRIMLFERLSLYFIVYNTILIPNIIEEIKSKDMKILAKLFSVILPFIQFMISTPGGSIGIDNYKIFWG